MIDFLASRGHRYHDLVNNYPLNLVVALYRAAQLNYRADMVSLAASVNVGVLAALDAAFGGGKNNILDKYTRTMLGEPLSPDKAPLTPRAAKFLASLPVKETTHGQ